MRQTNYGEKNCVFSTVILLRSFFSGDCNGTRTYSHLVRKRTLNHLAKWLSVRLRTKWLWVRVPLQSNIDFLFMFLQLKTAITQKCNKSTTHIANNF